MTILYTKKTVAVYGLGWFKYPDPRSLHNWIRPYREQMVKEGKTNGRFLVINPTTTVRIWADEASALGFIKVVEDAARETGRTDISVTIEDI
jgi:hypothetical protein